MKIFANKNKCKKCKCSLKNIGRYGEKKWHGWVYWCSNCYLKEFKLMVNSSPELSNKYMNIYGVTPDEKIKTPA